MKMHFFKILGCFLLLSAVLVTYFLVFSHSFRGIKDFYNPKQHSKAKAEFRILSLSAAEDESDTIFNDIKNHLKKITTYGLSRVSNLQENKHVSVFELAKITNDQ